jgi:hypothetical protein
MAAGPRSDRQITGSPSDQAFIYTLGDNAPLAQRTSAKAFLLSPDLAIRPSPFGFSQGRFWGEAEDTDAKGGASQRKYPRSYLFDITTERDNA